MRWECTQCGVCCKYFKIEIGLQDALRLQKLDYEPKAFLSIKNNKLFLKNNNRRCFFLRSDGLCEIHAKHGFEAKPAVCKRFPLTQEGSMRLCCGKIFLDKAKPAKINKEKYFLVGQNVLPVSAFLYALKSLNADNYMDRWNSIITCINKSKNKIISESDIDCITDKIKNKKGASFLRTLNYKLMLASYSRWLYYGFFRLCLKRNVLRLCLPIETFYLNMTINITVEKKTTDTFLNMLKKGHGLLYNNLFPEFLAFNFYWLEPFAKTIAKQHKRPAATLEDIVNAYATLNSMLVFKKR